MRCPARRGSATVGRCARRAPIQRCFVLRAVGRKDVVSPHQCVIGLRSPPVQADGQDPAGICVGAIVDLDHSGCFLPHRTGRAATAVGQVQGRRVTLGTVPRRKRGDGSSEEDDGGAQPSRAPTRVGVLVALVSGAVLLRMIGWFLRDNVLVPGVRLVEPGRAGIAMPIALVGIVVGRVMINTGSRIAGWRSPGPLLISLAGAGALVFVIVVGMGSYPTGTKAVLVGLDPSTGKVAWRTITPVTRLHNVRSVTTEELTVEGDSYRGCDHRPVAMRISRSTGRLLDVAPSRVTNAGNTPPAGFLFEQGRNRTSCSN